MLSGWDNGGVAAVARDFEFGCCYIDHINTLVTQWLGASLGIIPKLIKNAHPGRSMPSLKVIFYAF
jgi:hypothetical protein